MNIDPTNAPPTMSLTMSDPDSTGKVNVSVTVTDPEADPVTYLVLRDPSLRNFGAHPGGFTYTPPPNARHHAAAATATATDKHDSFTVAVNDAHHGITTKPPPSPSAPPTPHPPAPPTPAPPTPPPG